MINSFESSFGDKRAIPESLKMMWLKKAAGRYCAEVSSLHYDEEIRAFDEPLEQYTIDMLAEFMKQLYQERQVSLVNKQAAIATKDIGLDGANGMKAYEEKHLEYVEAKVKEMILHQTSSLK